MTADEWKALVVLIDECWPATDFPESREAAYLLVLSPYAANDVEVAIRAMLKKASPFAPSAAELIGALERERHGQSPTGREALGMVLDARSRWHPVTGKASALDQLRARSEVVGLWAELVWDDVDPSALDHAEYGGAARTRLIKEYDEYRERYEDRKARQDAYIETAERPFIKRSGDLRKLDTAAALELPSTNEESTDA